MIQAFTYNGKEREVFILEETESAIKGIDLSLLNEDIRQKFATDLLKIKDGDQELIESYAKLAFRHFKKSRMVVIEELE